MLPQAEFDRLVEALDGPRFHFSIINAGQNA